MKDTVRFIYIAHFSDRYERIVRGKATVALVFREKRILNLRRFKARRLIPYETPLTLILAHL